MERPRICKIGANYIRRLLVTFLFILQAHAFVVSKERCQYGAKATNGSFLKAENDNVKTFHFGAGCFWAPADQLRSIDGIVSTVVGYCGDDSYDNEKKTKLSYETVCGGRTSLVEAVQVKYDSTKLSFEDMMFLFKQVNTAEWNNKRQYQGVLFNSDEEEIKLIQKFLKENPQVVATTEPMTKFFWKAEKYHQDYWFKWKLRLATFFVIIGLVNSFGGDQSQILLNTICYGSIGLTLLERRVGNNVEKDRVK